MNEQNLQAVYQMVDRIQFSRVKKHIGRDFADGVMMAQLIHNYKPQLVQLHNYPTANSTCKKRQNWITLNNKVLKKIKLGINNQQIDEIINCVPNAIESLLLRFFNHFQKKQEEAHLTIHKKNPADKHQNVPHKHPIFSPYKQITNNKDQASEIMDLVDEIEQSASKLKKLQEISHLKDDTIRNLEKKFDKIIFND